MHYALAELGCRENTWSKFHAFHSSTQYQEFTGKIKVKIKTIRKKLSGKWTPLNDKVNVINIPQSIEYWCICTYSNINKYENVT